MKIVLLGSGKVASQLGSSLQTAGHDIEAVWSRTETHAKELADKLNTNFSSNLSEISVGADLYILSVSDDAIATIADHNFFADKILIHTSGATGLHTPNISGVFYPVQTFSKQRTVDFSSVPIVIEGIDSRVTEMLFSLGQSISSNVQIANSDQRRALHIAAVFANNFSNHFFAVAEEILNNSGLDFNLIRPLILETARKVQDINPGQAQTGPAVRNDQATIKSHLVFLADNEPLKELYSLISHSIANLHQKQ